MTDTDALVVESASEADTQRLGQALAAELPEGAVVALHGTLGAGKTRLVQAVAAAWGIEPREVVSPTFVLAAEHHGRRSLYHVDAYRLRDEDEFEALGQHEHFGGPGVVFIEWAEKIGGSLPEERIEIAIEVCGESARRFSLRSPWPAGRAALARLERRLAAEG
jgi:tRNA threonylcarbamoyladenosine biosynthesis protein TsaE